jgi:hypothetical protein
MKRRSSVLCAVFLLLSAGVANGQAILPERGQERGLRENVFGLGVFGGPASGFGLSFRHHLPSPFSYQITGGIIKVDDRLSYDIGCEAQYDLARGATSRFFVGAGAAYFYSGKTSHNDMNGPGRIGLGIGGEVAVSSGLHTSLDLMFTYFSDATVLPLPQLGFYYYFY